MAPPDFNKPQPNVQALLDKHFELKLFNRFFEISLCDNAGTVIFLPRYYDISRSYTDCSQDRTK